MIISYSMHYYLFNLHNELISIKRKHCNDREPFRVHDKGILPQSDSKSQVHH